jgi:hypothetical protein
LVESERLALVNLPVLGASCCVPGAVLSAWCFVLCLVRSAWCRVLGAECLVPSA